MIFGSIKELTTQLEGAKFSCVVLFSVLDLFLKGLFLGGRKMQSRINLFILVFVLSVTWIFLAEEAVIGAEEDVKPGVRAYPYLAEITGDNVNIRSGPGTNYYRCGKLGAGDRVKVVGSQFSWSRIVPPIVCQLVGFMTTLSDSLLLLSPPPEPVPAP